MTLRWRRNTCLSRRSATQQKLRSKKRIDSGGWPKKRPARIIENTTLNRRRTPPQYRLKKRARPTRFEQEAHENSRPGLPDDGPALLPYSIRGTPAGGFVLTREKAPRKWGGTTYAVIMGQRFRQSRAGAAGMQRHARTHFCGRRACRSWPISAL